MKKLIAIAIVGAFLMVTANAGAATAAVYRRPYRPVARPYAYRPAYRSAYAPYGYYPYGYGYNPYYYNSGLYVGFPGLNLRIR